MRFLSTIRLTWNPTLCAIQVRRKLCHKGLHLKLKGPLRLAAFDAPHGVPDHYISEKEKLLFHWKLIGLPAAAENVSVNKELN